jgi:hypothetical protein
MLAANPLCAVALLLLLLLPTASPSALLIVPDSHPTIQSAIDAAASGDSIMVRAGTYLEALVLAGKNLTLFGESGAELTLLTSNARVFDIGAGVDPTTVLSDLTIRGGFAEEGGGIRLRDGASPSLRRNRLMFNTSFRPAGSSWGGAMIAGNGSSPVIEDCIFRENVADYLCCEPPGQGHGGAISASAGSNIRVVRTTFLNNFAAGFEGGFGGAIHVESGASAVLEDCTFHENWAIGGGVSSAGNLTIRRCVFTRQLGYTAAAVSSGGQCAIEQSLFYDNECWGEPGVIQISGNGPNELRNNTIAFNTQGGVSIVQAVASVRNNIISSNSNFGLSCFNPAPGSITCNDVWDNSPNYEAGCPDPTGTDGNISLDPMFCDVDARDLRLGEDSPCAPGASACGLIGAQSVCSVGGGESAESAVKAPRLLPLRPNPILLPARLAFELPAPARVQLLVYNAQGRLMDAPADGWFEAGRHELIWAARTAEGRELSSGVYFLELQAGGRRRTERLVLIR